MCMEIMFIYLKNSSNILKKNHVLVKLVIKNKLLIKRIEYKSNKGKS